MKDLFSLAVIPARGGSKRIPRKNIKEFCGKPIIAYSIAAAKQAGCFAEIIVSTDDRQIADIALKYGAQVPFMRSQSNSGDQAGLQDALKEAVAEYEKWSKKRVDLVCCILPTAPFVDSRNLVKGQKMMLEEGIDALTSIAKYSYPIQRALSIEGRYCRMIWPENDAKRSQELQDSFHDAGQFYWIKRDKLFEFSTLFIPRSGFICLDQMQVQDIDTEDDWRSAEVKFKLLNQKCP